jgi:hypothetical protein
MHQYPELSFAEHRTAATVADRQQLETGLSECSANKLGALPASGHPPISRSPNARSTSSTADR